MKLVIGGVYQGKTALAAEKYGLLEGDVEVCTDDAFPKFDRKCVSHLERFALYCVKNALEPKDELKARIEKIKDCILISDDISCGVVPVDKTERAWREATGRMLSYLAQQSETVTRVFCGIEQTLKGEKE